MSDLTDGLTDLEYQYLDRLLRIRQHADGDVECVVQMLGVVSEIDVAIQHAKVTGDKSAEMEYVALRRFVKDSI